METFLTWIGLYNVFGAAILMLMHFESVADFILRKGTEIVPLPYKHEGYSRMWLWWAAMVNVFMGLIMWRAAGWPVEIQREVTLFAIVVYVIGWLCVLLGCRRPRYARGIYAIHPLWLGQIAWGAYGYWASL